MTCAAVVLPVLLAASCDRAPQTPATAPAGIQEVAGDYDPAEWGHLDFRITAVYVDQQLSEEFPGHRDGGPWVFMDCAAAAPGGDVPFVVGVRTLTVPGGPDGEAPTNRGHAVVRTADRAGTDAFLALFAASFHTDVPEPLIPKPLHPVVFGTEILGTALNRAANDNGFMLGGGGTWTATKWLPTTPRLHAEVFLNYSLATRQGEFAEKDFSQRENLMAFWARALRDGPRGQRTPQEDPNVSATGPQLGPLTPIAGAEARHAFFVPGGKWLVYATAALLQVPGLRIIGTAAEKAGVLSFVLDGVRTEQVGDLLNREGIAVRAGHHCAQPIHRRFGLESTVRASLALYNTCSDIDALAGALLRIQTARPGRSV